jgi:methylmalonyl-CoA mutase, N-terminal domain
VLTGARVLTPSRALHMIRAAALPACPARRERAARFDAKHENPVNAEQIARRLLDWKTKAGAVPRRATSAGIEEQALYTALDRAAAPGSEAAELETPGAHPFTRGIYPTMYRGRLWTMRQYAGFSSAAETNRRFRYLLDSGQTGLSTAFDLPTQMGYDPDHELAEGEVGKVGVSIACLDDMDELFDQIPLDRVSTSMTINATAIVLLALYVAAGKRRGISEEKLSGTIQNDILKEYAARGTYRFPAAPSLRLITDIFDYASRRLPKFNTISISGYHMREAGCTAVQEVAFTLANGAQYVRSAVERGLDVDVFAARLSFFFSCDNVFFEEVAKFRAARRLWATIMRERFQAKRDESCMLRFHTQTAGSTLTSRQIDTNVVRVTLQALAAVLGGTQSLHTNSRDEALSLPTEESARLALRTQQVIAFESGVADVIDPLGGSYFVESLTDEIERRASEYIEKIDGMGGSVRAIEQGFLQREIHRAAYEAQKRIEKGEDVVVGVNKFTIDEPQRPRAFRVDESVRDARARRLAAVRGRRDAAAAEGSLVALRAAAAGVENLFPRVLACVEANVTLGEICAALEQVFGRYREVAVL